MDFSFQASVDSTETFWDEFSRSKVCKSFRFRDRIIDLLIKIIVNCSSNLDKPTNYQTPSAFNVFLQTWRSFFKQIKELKLLLFPFLLHKKTNLKHFVEILLCKSSKSRAWTSERLKLTLQSHKLVSLKHVEARKRSTINKCLLTG